ncbi:MAG: fused MFS/spermidine synthase [Verrucomicrobiaceae bacterium]
MNIVFCLVSLLGAFLLFQVQPVISKFILPWFGGSPGVWTTCMLFFQVVLFGGYSYAHLLARCRPRTQAWVHGAALLAALLLLPIIPNVALKPTGAEEPVGRILLLLTVTVGFPYLVLSATSPLMQVWFSHLYPQRSPWRLYSLSNIGSLTALLTYPVLIETRWDVIQQAQIWSGVFVAFVVLMAVCAFSNHTRPDVVTPEGDPHPHTETHNVRPTWIRRALWLLLPGFASLLLLGTTNYVCQDVAVIPFLWIAPLSLYLISFIICFDHPRWYQRSAWAVLATGLLFFGSAMYRFEHWSPDFVTELAVLLAAMFTVCMVCHGELARLKPATKYLTEYYLLMSAGGALGGLTVSIVAPLVFDTYMEWTLALIAGFILVAWVAFAGLPVSLRSMPVAFGWVVLVLAGLVYLTRWEFSFAEKVERYRDFYGMLSISEYKDEDTGDTLRSFIHGSIKHGRQNMTPAHRRDPLTYYSHPSAIGRALETLKTRPDARVGVIGMGAGTVACYAEKGQTYRFYEINPNSERLALKWFTYIPDMQTRGAIYESVIGDARLSLEHEKPQNFDVILLDAFSGDSVPVHLLTYEAFELYLRHLKPDGIIAVHITNYSLNLAPVVERAARELGMPSIRMANDLDENGCYPTDYVLLTRNTAFIQANPPVVPDYARAIDVPLWTDRRHNLFQILDNH